MKEKKKVKAPGFGVTLLLIIVVVALIMTEAC